jgi:very-short-patch-repair endonuclease
MGIFICDICDDKYDNLTSLLYHSVQKHKKTSEEIYIEYVLKGVKPKCECGCGDNPNFISFGKGFSRFIKTHHNRVKGKNNFHKNPETHKKAIETQKKNWREGKYVGWWEKNDEETKNKIEGIKDKLRSDKERSKKISNALKGVPKSEKSKLKLSETQKLRFKNNPELRERMSIKRIKWLKSKLSNKKSRLECNFELILKLVGLEFVYQYELENKLFDFYLPKFKVLIEVDGDFYHCNPNSKHKEVVYETQLLTKNNDKIKNEICLENNITLIRYWEKDINERPEWVISDLKNKLSIE